MKMPNIHAATHGGGGGVLSHGPRVSAPMGIADEKGFISQDAHHERHREPSVFEADQASVLALVHCAPVEVRLVVNRAEVGQRIPCRDEPSQRGLVMLGEDSKPPTRRQGVPICRAIGERLEGPLLNLCRGGV